MRSVFIPLHKAIDDVYSQFFLNMYMNKSVTLSQ